MSLKESLYSLRLPDFHPQGLARALRYSAAGLLSGVSLILPAVASAQTQETYVTLLTPNGGDIYVGQTVPVMWTKSNNVSDCQLYFEIKPPGEYGGQGSYFTIGRAYTGTGAGDPRVEEYDWTVDVGPMDPSNVKEGKVVLNCFVVGGGPQVESKSIDYLRAIQ